MTLVPNRLLLGLRASTAFFSLSRLELNASAVSPSSVIDTPKTLSMAVEPLNAVVVPTHWASYVVIVPGVSALVSSLNFLVFRDIPETSSPIDTSSDAFWILCAQAAKAIMGHGLMTR